MNELIDVKKKKAYEENLISNLIKSIEKYGGKECLSSVILTGSLGRHEATYAISREGRLHLKSDVEIALIYYANKAIVEDLASKVASDFQEDLNLMIINEKRIKKIHNFNNSFKVPKYKTIFTYDLFNGSETIWGKDYISNSQVSLESCDVYEAKRLVANRIGELVYLQTTNSNDIRTMEDLCIQWKSKLILAIASAWLICTGLYTSSYHGQYNVVKKNEPDIRNILGKEFFYDYSNAFGFLRESGKLYETSDNRLCEYVDNINKFFVNIGIGKPKVNTISRVLKYYKKYIKTKMRYGLLGFEDAILQSLIDEFYMKNNNIILTAKVWHDVLY